MSSFVISPAAPHELLPACRLLFAGRTGPDRDRRAERCRDSLLSGGESSGLFVARDADGKLRATTLVQALPGAMGVSWPPRGDSPEAEDAVTSAACAWLRSQRVKVCQAFAASDEVADMAPLERHGFRHVTQLVFLRRELSPGATPAPTRELTFIADGPPFSFEFEGTLLATHEDTRDCPELNESRTLDELLRGFTTSASGEWYLVRRGTERAGVLMLEFAAEETIDLTYIGVVPAVRGRGIGAELLKFALSERGGELESVALTVNV